MSVLSIALQRQLAATAHLTGENVKVGRKVATAKKLLSAKGPGLVFAMIQKYAERDADGEIDKEKIGEFPVLNEDESIAVLIDEAHRSHTKELHGNLQVALPNCARIGFTGTPIIMGAKKKTTKIFGEYIDTYKIRQAEEDGAVVPIRYEGRTAEGAVAGGGDLDQLFEDMVTASPAVLEKIKEKYAIKGEVLEAEALILDKARDMLRHWVQT